MKKHAKKTVYIDSSGHRLRLLVFTPASGAKNAPGVLWIHGGGYATGMPEMFYFTRARSLVDDFGAVVVLPDYRLSGKAPYPAAVEDCYATLLWLRDSAESLGVDPSRLMVGGESAGGGLTAAVSMMARDRGEVNISFQMPLYPMLDDRDTDSSRDNRAPVWNTRRNHAAWKLYLRNISGTPPVYAAPARETDYSGLPPAYTYVGDIEPFYVETVEYVEKLKKAGVEASVDVYPRWFHAYDLFFPLSKRARRAKKSFEEHFLYAAENYKAEQLLSDCRQTAKAVSRLRGCAANKS